MSPFFEKSPLEQLSGVDLLAPLSIGKHVHDFSFQQKAPPPPGGFPLTFQQHRSRQLPLHQAVPDWPENFTFVLTDQQGSNNLVLMKQSL